MFASKSARIPPSLILLRHVMPTHFHPHSHSFDVDLYRSSPNKDDPYIEACLFGSRCHLQISATRKSRLDRKTLTTSNQLISITKNSLSSFDVGVVWSERLLDRFSDRIRIKHRILLELVACGRCKSTLAASIGTGNDRKDRTTQAASLLVFGCFDFSFSSRIHSSFLRSHLTPSRPAFTRLSANL